MTEIDVRVAPGRVEATGEEVEVLIVPEGYVGVLMAREEAERYAEWSEAKAVRIRVEGDTLAALEVTNDEDWVTSPEADRAA